MIAANATTRDIRVKAIEEKMAEFRQSAMLKVARGETSTEEVFRVIPVEHLVVGAIDGAHSTFADPRDDAAVPKYLTDAWLADCTLFGPAARVREGLEAWCAAGIRTPIVVPSSTAGNQMKAFAELFAALAA